MKGIPVRAKPRISHGARAQRKALAKTNRASARITAKTNRLRSKTKMAKAKANFARAKLAQKALRGGGSGKRARARLKKISEAEMNARINKLKPGLYKEAQKTQIETDAKVKMTKAKGAASAGVASALSGGYTAGKEADARKEISRAEADKSIADAMERSLGNLDSVDTEQVASVSGLTEGVR